MSVPALVQALKAMPAAKAIVSVHMAGLAHAAAEIRQIADGRIVIEDAAHALGGLYPCGKAIGSGAYSDLTVFSFHPVKQITTGEGGAVLTNDPGWRGVLSCCAVTVSSASPTALSVATRGKTAISNRGSVNNRCLVSIIG